LKRFTAGDPCGAMRPERSGSIRMKQKFYSQVKIECVFLFLNDPSVTRMVGEQP
jgi:hypothetical protein